MSSIRATPTVGLYCPSMTTRDSDSTIPKVQPEHPSSGERFAPGARVLHYQIVELLGKGGMGEVYLARDERLGRDVALKFLPETVVKDQQVLDRFHREAQAAARISHESVARVYAIEYLGIEPFIASEYVRGTDLSHAIQQGTLTRETAYPALIQVAAGLAAAHAKGVIHRDIKARNIRLRPEGAAVIVDFGLGKILVFEADDPTQRVLTRDNQLLGTVFYMAPEQVRGEDVSFAADVFSLGVLAYEVLTGTRPFDRRTAGATMAAILSDTAPGIRTVRPDVPAEVAAVVAACLAKEPTSRPTADEVVQSLTSLVTDAQPAESGGSHAAPVFSSTGATQEIASKPTVILASSFPDDAWFATHRDRARQVSGAVGHVTLDVAARVVGEQNTLSIAQLYNTLRGVRSQSASYIGKVYDEDRWRPHRGVDDIYAVLSFDVTKHYWYWGVRRTGDVYLSTVIEADAERKRLSIESLLREFIADLIYISRLAPAFVSHRDASLLIRADLHGAAGHSLFGKDWRYAFVRDLEFWDRRNEHDAITSVVRAPLSALVGDVRGVVDLLFGDLAAYFNFLTVPAEYLDYAVDAMTSTANAG